MIFQLAGVKNVTALGNVIQWQKVTYDFEYHTQDFTTDVPVLVLSEGMSFLPVSVFTLFHLHWVQLDLHNQFCVCLSGHHVAKTSWDLVSKLLDQFIS